MAQFTRRDLLEVFLFTIITFGLYSIYWAVMTKRELNRAGAIIPSAILIIIPFINLYFWYRYVQAYVKIVRKSYQEMDVLVYLLIMILPGIHLIGMAILQNGYNCYQD